MKPVMHIQLSVLLGHEVPAGASVGRAAFATILSRITHDYEGIIAVDFDGVEIATASWLREAIVAFVNYAHASRRMLFPVLVNLTPIVQEELDITVHSMDLVCICASLKAGTIECPFLVGPLEPIQREMLQAVCDADQADAPTLRKQFPEVSLSAMNNRLAALEERGLLRSERGGKTRRYTPVIKGLNVWVQI